MNIHLAFDLPNEKICGVYRIDFDNGMFYIGSSTNIRYRASYWKSHLLGKKPNDMIRMTNKILNCRRAVIRIIEKCELHEIRDIEEDYLQKHYGDCMFLNTFSFNRKPILIFDLNGNFLEECQSASWVSKKKGIKLARVKDVLTGVKKSHRGLVYKYKSKEHEYLKPRREKKRMPKPITIFRYSVSGEYIDGFQSQYAAAKFIGVNKKSIYKVLKGKQKTAGGYVFRKEPNFVL